MGAATAMLKTAALALLVLSCFTSTPAANAVEPERTCGKAAGLSYCLLAGDNPLIVLLTGLGNSMQSWPASFVRALNAFAGVLVYDRRGHGTSAALTGAPVTARDAAADLDALLERLHVRRPVILVGHSLGGLYAQYFARNYPKRVIGVVLLDASSPFEPVGDPTFRTRAKLAPGSTDDLENRGVDPSVVQTRESRSFGRIPLVVVSATDHASPPAFEARWQEIQAETATQSPLGRIVVAQGSGHDVHEDQPGLVVDQIRAMVASLRAAGAK